MKADFSVFTHDGRLTSGGWSLLLAVAFSGLLLGVIAAEKRGAAELGALAGLGWMLSGAGYAFGVPALVRTVGTGRLSLLMRTAVTSLATVCALVCVLSLRVTRNAELTALPIPVEALCVLGVAISTWAFSPRMGRGETPDRAD